MKNMKLKKGKAEKRGKKRGKKSYTNLGPLYPKAYLAQVGPFRWATVSSVKMTFLLF